MSYGTHPDLKEVVEEVLRPICEKAGLVELELDIPDGLPCPRAQKTFEVLIRQLAFDSVRSMPGGGELTVIGFSFGTAIELEISDTRDLCEHPASIPIAARQMGADLQWDACPQGGSAVTIRWHIEPAEQRKAA